MSLSLFTPALDSGPGTRRNTSDQHVSENPVRINTMYAQYQHVQELQRERLRQAENYRLQRLALRARRAVASQLIR